MTAARYFFIVGLPRSRTAWLSNLFTTGRVFCFHDASRMVKNLPDLHSIVHESRVEADYIGTSDNGLPLMPAALGWYKKQDPEVPVVIVRRPVDEVRRSLHQLHGGQVPQSVLDSMLERSIGGLDLIEGGSNSITVRFSDLDSMATLEAMWDHLIPTIPFDMQRAAALRGLNVQLCQPWYDKGFSEEFVQLVTGISGGQ
jgi:hypothetical protein